MNSVRRGRLITLEGIEGAGKSTHAETVCAALRDRGLTVVAAHEPGGTALGGKLRELLLSKANADVTAEAELLLMFAARAELIRRVVRPALEQGHWVVSDRFTDASYAYQGGGRGCARETLDALSRIVCRETRPDLTFLLDITPKEGAARVGKRGEKDRFETEGADFFERVRKAYLTLAAAEPQRWRVIAAGQELEQVKAEVVSELDAFLETIS